MRSFSLPKDSKGAELQCILEATNPPSPRRRLANLLSWNVRLCLAVLCALTWLYLNIVRHDPIGKHPKQDWGPFPRHDDPFHFLPCTNATSPPLIDDPHPLESWWRLYEPNPQYWMRGEGEPDSIFLCGWLDVPLDYTNTSDKRIARLAVNRFQNSPHAPSNRTVVVHPGGPGGPGAQWVLSDGQELSQKFSDGTLDVLGWDPRGVKNSQPWISCFPYEADRDRWRVLTSRFYRESSDVRLTMLTADAMNESILKACKDKYGDIGGMLGTAFNARDLEEIRKAMGEEELNGYFISYGTEVGQTYANMFPNSVGRLVLDGAMYARQQRLLGGSAWAGVDNITAAFEDGFIGECVDAGPKHCALAQPIRKGDPLPSKQDLIDKMQGLFSQLIRQPMPGYTEASGPIIITYSQLASLISLALYSPEDWTGIASAVYDLMQGNTTLISPLVDNWSLGPMEFLNFVICADQYDSPLPPGFDVDTNGEQWYLSLWKHMATQAEMGGQRNFLFVLPCRHWNSTFGPPKEVYRGDLNHSLSNPVLVVGVTYDPATPLYNARKLLHEMGRDNARLIAHHGYGHTSLSDKSTCTNDLIRAYLVNGTLPNQAETPCFADQKPYRYTDNIAKR